MKKTLLILALIYIPHLLTAQYQINTLNITTNDLVYDANSKRIYASIPSANGSNGNSIGVINPNSFALENTVFIGSEPTVLAISDNGQYIYSGFSGSGTISRFNVTTQTAEIQFALGSDNSTGAYFAEDIEVMPGFPNTIAVSRMNVGFTPRHEGVAIYDDGVMRSITTQDHTGSNKIEFKNSTTLFGYNSESTEYGLRRLAVNAGGITEVSVNANILNSPARNFIYHNDYIYGDDGKVVNVSSAPYVAGQFTGATGPAVFDVVRNKICYASYTQSGVITFKVYNPNTFLVEEAVPIPQAFGTVKNIVKCGNGCYAFNTSDNKLVIIKNPNLNTDEFQMTKKMELYPNPVSDVAYLDVKFEIKSIEIYDINGRIIKKTESVGSNINLSMLNSGMYLMKLIDRNGTVFNKKFIKK